jgi:uncharacterized protein (DUF1778 family)
MPGYSEPRHLIRLALKGPEHKLVRLAAAVEGLSMAEFCRQAALERARRTNIQPPEPPAPEKPKRKRGKK